MKNSLHLLPAAILLLTAPTFAAERVVLVEEFSGTW